LLAGQPNAFGGTFVFFATAQINAKNRYLPQKPTCPTHLIPEIKKK